MSDPLAAIVYAAVDLKNASPKPFDALVVALKAYEESLRDNLTIAPSDTIFIAQGRVQAIAQVRKKLEDCLKHRADLEKRRT